jgi:hypothetical protein
LAHGLQSIARGAPSEYDLILLICGLFEENHFTREPNCVRRLFALGQDRLARARAMEIQYYRHTSVTWGIAIVMARANCCEITA